MVESSLRWIWDAEKNRRNKRTHGLSFETAVLVFDDPLAASQPDPSPDEERWQTIGMIGGVVVFVVHTWPPAGHNRRGDWPHYQRPEGNFA